MKNVGHAGSFHFTVAFLQFHKGYYELLLLCLLLKETIKGVVLEFVNIFLVLNLALTDVCMCHLEESYKLFNIFQAKKLPISRRNG